MIKIGVTGNIGSGKSEVEKILKEMGFKTICADEISHKTFEKEDIKEKINEIFKTTNKKEIAEIIFKDKEKKNELENILHPEIKKEIELFFDRNKNEKFVFAIVPLLFEANFENIFDKIIFISASEEIRLNRILKRNNYEKNHAIARIKSQADEKEKISKSNFVIKNEKGFEELKEEVEKIVKNLKGA